MAIPAPIIRQRFFDNNGEPLSGGRLYTYEAGTTTPLVTKKDQAGVENNTNPIILDSSGYCDVWLITGSYKFVLRDSNDVMLWTKDNIASLADLLNTEGALAVVNNLSDLASISTAKTNLGLNNVDNTSDANKPISTATQTALDAKVGHSTLTSGRVPVTGSGNTIAHSSVTSTELGYLSGATSAIQTQLDDKQSRSTLTTKGDLYVATASGTVSRLGVGTNNQVLTADSAEATGMKWANQGSPIAPKVTRYTSGSGTHTMTGSPVYIIVEMVGGGGGGAGSGTASSSSNGSSGDNTTFGSSLLTADGGFGANWGGAGAAGGAFTINSPAISILGISGGGGGGGCAHSTTSIATPGGFGGQNLFGGAGNTNYNGQAGSSAANSGAGGGGGGQNGVSNSFSGPGGGAGGYIKAMISSPASSYSYSIGGGGAGGNVGTSGTAAGRAGAAGVLIVTEYYQ